MVINLIFGGALVLFEHSAGTYQQPTLCQLGQVRDVTAARPEEAHAPGRAPEVSGELRRTDRGKRKFTHLLTF